MILQPGPTTNLLKSNVSIKSTKLNQFNSGGLFSTTVYVTAAGMHPTGFEVLRAWADGNQAVLPTAAIYSAKESADSAQLKEKNAMQVSQTSAALAAHQYLTEIGQTPSWNPSDVKIEMKEVGGASGGLAFTLAILAKTSGLDLVANRKIAVTGTISKNGTVGAIGGVDQKILGASHVGSTIFIAPISNCSEISKSPAGMKIYGVKNLREAIEVLVSEKDSSVFTCPKK